MSDLENYVREARANGMSDESIRNALTAEGWMPDTVNTALASQDTAPTPTPPPSQQTVSFPQNTVSAVHGTKKHGGKSLLIIVVVLILLGAAGASAYYYAPRFFSKAPFDTETFFVDFISGLSTVHSSTYVTDIVLLTEPKNASAQSLREVFPEFAPENAGPSNESNQSFGPIVINALIEAEDEIFPNISPSLSAKLSISGSADRSSGEYLESYGTTQFVGFLDLGDFVMNVDVVFTIHEGSLYGRINRMPPLPSYDIEKIRGTWIKIADMVDKETGAPATARFGTDVSSKESQDIMAGLRTLPHNADLSAIATITDPVQDETNGVRTWRYDLTFNADNIARFFENVIADMRGSVPADEVELFEAMAVQNRVVFEDPSVTAFLRHLFSQSDMSVWATDDGVPLKITVTNHLVPSTQHQSNQDTPQQLTTSLTLTLDNINEPIQVVAPEDFITLEEAYELLFPMMDSTEMNYPTSQFEIQ